MKSSIIKYLTFFLVFIFLFNFSNLKAQLSVTPIDVSWLVDGQKVTLKKGYNEGVNKCEKLTIQLFFDKSILKTYSKDQLNFEFKWFYYYVTKKEFMDSYTVTYNGSAVSGNNSFSISSSRENIGHGWWEVQVISKIDGKSVAFDNIARFQIYVD